jgi:hypothetical protein
MWSLSVMTTVSMPDAGRPARWQRGADDLVDDALAVLAQIRKQPVVGQLHLHRWRCSAAPDHQQAAVQLVVFGRQDMGDHREGRPACSSRLSKTQS